MKTPAFFLLIAALLIFASSLAQPPTGTPSDPWPPPNPPPNPSTGDNIIPITGGFGSPPGSDDGWGNYKHTERARAFVEAHRKDMCARPAEKPPGQTQLEAQAPCVDCDTSKMIQSLGLGALVKQAAELGTAIDRPSDTDLAFFDFFEKESDIGRGYLPHPERTGTTASLAFDRRILAAQDATIKAYKLAQDGEIEADSALQSLEEDPDDSGARARLKAGLDKVIAGLEHKREIQLAHVRNFRQLADALDTAATDGTDILLPGVAMKPEPLSLMTTESLIYKSSVGGMWLWKNSFAASEKQYREMKQNAATTAEHLSQSIRDYRRLHEWAGKPSAERLADHERIVAPLGYRAFNETHYLDSIKAERRATQSRIEHLEKRQAALAELVKKHGALPRAVQLEEKYISIVAGKPVCGQSVSETLAIIAYANAAFSNLNQALRAGGELREKVLPFDEVLRSGLEKMKPVRALVTRGADLPPERFAQHRIGEIVTYPGYTSTSLAAGFDKKHRFYILSKTGRYIGDTSNYSTEFEVLFKSGTKFKILDSESVGDHTNIVMEEVE